jgi:hypothetical protein
MTSIQGMTTIQPTAALFSEFPVAFDARIILWDVRRKRHSYDAMWWPRSRNLTAELPNLNLALRDRCGPLAHVMFNLAFWEATPRRIRIDGQRIRLAGFYKLQPSLVIATGNDGRRVDLLVISPETDPGAARAMADMRPTEAISTVTAQSIRDSLESSGGLGGLDLSRSEAYRLRP